MPLAHGAHLGPYEIVAPLGAGGMGEVYRAHDTRLGRDVAIKVLPEGFARDQERLARFEREAKLLASLNHPNIAGIHGFEEADGLKALVLELVEGPTLAEKIAKGSIPVDEALAIARQIAEALEAGHEAGVVHRDLKPANIKLKEDGTVKVLDYGLAKALEAEAHDSKDSELSQSPTLTRQTQMGMILGTASYMSPEQAKGKRVNKRADIWSFGAVLYEMLTGQRAFGGEDVSDALAAVLRAEPDFDVLPSETPEPLRNALRLCLKKDPKERFRDIGDVSLALTGAFSSELTPGVVSKRPSTVVIAAAFLLGALVAGLAVWSFIGSEPVPRPVTRFSIALPHDQTLSGFQRRNAVLSPDGNHLVYNANEMLYLHTMDEAVTVPLLTPPKGFNLAPFFSPDGEWVGFWADGQLQKVSILGGPAVPLCDAQDGQGAWWAADDTIFFASEGAILRVPARGGTPEIVLPKQSGRWASHPQVLPGEKWVLSTFSVPGGYGTAQIVAHAIATGEQRMLVERGRMGRYLPTGHLTYVQEETLFGVAFDVETLQVTGAAIPLVQDVRMSPDGFAAQYSFSNTGSLVYLTGSSQEERTLVWVDRTGKEEMLSAEPRGYVYPRISPDGGRVALDVRDQDQDIWIWDLARETMTRVTFGPTQDSNPIWTPDGERVTFISDRSGGPLNLYWKAADGTGTAERLAEGEERQIPYSFTADGGQLVYLVTPEESLRLLDEKGSSKLLLRTEFLNRNAAISPDGRWLAYQSNASGEFEIYVRSFPDVNEGQWQISRGGGTRPVWAPDGNGLFFLSPRGEMMAVPIRAEPAFAPGNPEILFPGDYYSGLPGRSYDISADGKRFLMIKQGGSGETFHIVLNWFEEVKRLIPPAD